MKKIILLFISVSLLILTSCSQKPTENESDYTAFLNMLADSKFQYTEGDLDTFSYLSVARKPVIIGDEIISIYEYAFLNKNYGAEFAGHGYINK